MAVVLPLERPTSAATSGPIISAGTIGNYNTGLDYYIKVARIAFKVTVPDDEVSGDGDAAPSFLPSRWTYFDCQLGGFMIAQQLLGFLALRATTTNPMASGTVMTFACGATHTISARVVIRSIEVNFDIKGEYVGVALEVRGTCNAAGANTLTEATS